MPHLFDHARACTQWKHRCFALKKKFASNRPLLSKRVAKLIAKLPVARIDLQLPDAITKNNRAGVWQLCFERIEDEHKKNIVVRCDSSQQFARFVVTAEAIADDANKAIVFGQTFAPAQDFVEHRAVRSNSSIARERLVLLNHRVKNLHDSRLTALRANLGDVRVVED